MLPPCRQSEWLNHNCCESELLSGHSQGRHAFDAIGSLKLGRLVRVASTRNRHLRGSHACTRTPQRSSRYSDPGSSPLPAIYLDATEVSSLLRSTFATRGSSPLRCTPSTPYAQKSLSPEAQHRCHPDSHRAHLVGQVRDRCHSLRRGEPSGSVPSHSLATLGTVGRRSDSASDFPPPIRDLYEPGLSPEKVLVTLGGVAILRFRHKGLELFFGAGKRSKIQAQHAIDFA